ncbi:hypothetical protein ANN_07048 [Periplaneta americana]|uniref:Uncharacterized protein n=1 Tax=Periplaneta americana TaxID=6978 RepID=A0ABQ8THM5_PERAM|nr:hypothetical protein ANN_07048 [Periplaneta americana]
MTYKICFLSEQCHCQASIARQTGVSRCAVQEILREKLQLGTVDDRKRTGRPKKLTARDEQYLKVTALRSRTASSAQLATELSENSNTKVHASTV